MCDKDIDIVTVTLGDFTYKEQWEEILVWDCFITLRRRGTVRDEEVILKRDEKVYVEVGFFNECLGTFVSREGPTCATCPIRMVELVETRW